MFVVLWFQHFSNSELNISDCLLLSYKCNSFKPVPPVVSGEKHTPNIYWQDINTKHNMWIHFNIVTQELVLLYVFILYMCICKMSIVVIWRWAVESFLTYKIHNDMSQSVGLGLFCIKWKKRYAVSFLLKGVNESGYKGRCHVSKARIKY